MLQKQKISSFISLSYTVHMKYLQMFAVKNNHMVGTRMILFDNPLQSASGVQGPLKFVLFSLSERQRKPN